MHWPWSKPRGATCSSSTVLRLSCGWSSRLPFQTTAKARPGINFLKIQTNNLAKVQCCLKQRFKGAAGKSSGVAGPRSAAVMPYEALPFSRKPAGSSAAAETIADAKTAVDGPRTPVSGQKSKPDCQHRPISRASNRGHLLLLLLLPLVERRRRRVTRSAHDAVTTRQPRPTGTRRRIYRLVLCEACFWVSQSSYPLPSARCSPVSLASVAVLTPSRCRQT